MMEDNICICQIIYNIYEIEMGLYKSKIICSIFTALLQELSWFGSVSCNI